MRKKLALLVQQIPGLKIIAWSSLGVFLIWGIVLFLYYRQARQTEEKILSDYLKNRSEPMAEQVQTQGLPRREDSLAFTLDAHRRLGLQYLADKQYLHAIPHLERVIDTEDLLFLEENRQLCLELADAYIGARFSDKALTFLNKVKPAFKNPDWPYLKRMGMACFYAGDHVNAARYFRQAVDKNPEEAESLVFLARLYYRQDPKRKDVPLLFERALAADTLSVPAHYYYGVYFLDKGNYDKARRHFSRVIDVEPFNTKAMARLGMLYYYLKAFEKSKEMYELALSINPTDYNTLYNLGELYLFGFSDPLNAYKCFRRLIDLQPRHFWALKKMGVIALNNRNYKEACVWLEKAYQVRAEEREFQQGPLAFDKELVSVLILNATALEALEQYGEARIKLQMALKENPLNTIAHHKLELLKTGS